MKGWNTAMYGIFKKAFHFTEDEISESPLTKLQTRRIVRQIRIQPSVTAQEVPDWVKDTDLFKYGEADGNIEEWVKPVRVKPLAAAAETVQQPKPAGFGAVQPVAGQPPVGGGFAGGAKASGKK